MRTAPRRCPAGAGVLRDAPGHESMRAAAPGCAGRPLQLFRALNRFPSIDDAENRLAARAARGLYDERGSPRRDDRTVMVLGLVEETPLETPHVAIRPSQPRVAAVPATLTPSPRAMY